MSCNLQGYMSGAIQHSETHILPPYISDATYGVIGLDAPLLGFSFPFL